MIEYRNVHKSFDVPVLSGVDLTVETGEMFALFGPSGTGKSVLLKTTIDLICPDRGDVRVDGESVYYGPRGTLDRVRRKVGYVFQYAALFDSLSVRDNVLMGLPEDRLKTMTRKDQASRVWETLEKVNLDPRIVLGNCPPSCRGA